MITGSLVALVTPMNEDGSINFDDYKKLIDWHVEEKTDAIVAMGTTGESPTVNFAEHHEVIRKAVEFAAGRLPVVAGAGGNSTAEAIELTHSAKKAGANATLQVVPYYNKPTQEGLYQHFKAIALAEPELPIILYNVPGRTVCDLKNETVLRLINDVPNIVGLKDATGDLARAIDLLSKLPPNRPFALYSGNDDSALALMLIGGQGVISVTANILPARMHEMTAAALKGDIALARRLNDSMLPLHQKLFCEPNPIAPKWLLAQMGKIPTGIRLPLSPLSEKGKQTVLRAYNDSL